MMKKNKHKDTDQDINKEDIDTENTAASQNEQPAGDPIAAELEKLKAEYAKLDDQMRRISADYANYQKRVPRQIDESIAYKTQSIIKSLLPGMDNFDHALAHTENATLDSMIKGVRMVYDNFLAILKSHGLEQINAAGCQFDPNCHQAVMNRYDADKKEGIVLDQYQNGYKLNGITIRPAMVVVNKQPQAPVDETIDCESSQDELSGEKTE